MVSRRSIITRLAGLTSAVGLAGCSRILGRSEERPDLGLPTNPRANVLPHRQHGQNAFMRADRYGNPIVPRHHRLLLLDLNASPSVADARTVERAMRTLEAAYDWSPEGLFHTLGWGTAYFSRLSALSRSPIRRPRVLSRTEEPDLLDFDAIVRLASDVPSHLSATESAMFGDRSTLNGVPVEHRLSEVFSIRDRRTGFVGEGLPAAHTAAEGIPNDAPLANAPMFMGFRSKRKGTQANEDRVTIESDAFAGGTTVHLSHIDQSLSDWYHALSESGRAARMFSPQFTPAEIEEFGDDVPFTDQVEQHARQHDVVGHHEKVARVREGGEPLLLRRDFNTVDGGHAGVHFFSLQRSLSDFEKTRKSMNGWYLRDDSQQITDEQNNGILDFITVVSRANFYVPPRATRAFPEL
jgi:hypothetical protein